MIGLDYNAIVAQITEVCGDVFPYVTYAVTPQQIHWLSANPVYPAAFISPAGKETEPNAVGSAGDLRQVVVESFSVCVLFANEGDMLGQTAAESVPTFRELLRSALVNWHPLPLSRTSQPIIEDKDELFIFEGGARTGWLFYYSQRYQISTPDCYIPPAVSPIVITATVTPQGP